MSEMISSLTERSCNNALRTFVVKPISRISQLTERPVASKCCRKGSKVYKIIPPFKSFLKKGLTLSTYAIKVVIRTT